MALLHLPVTVPTIRRSCCGAEIGVLAYQVPDWRKTTVSYKYVSEKLQDVVLAGVSTPLCHRRFSVPPPDTETSVQRCGMLVRTANGWARSPFVGEKKRRIRSVFVPGYPSTGPTSPNQGRSMTLERRRIYSRNPTPATHIICDGNGTDDATTPKC